MDQPLYTFKVATIAGELITLKDYAGQVLLIVNTASQCGFTPQYAGLEALYQKYQSQGFTVLGFPCNQFGGQEPGSAQEIATFCTQHFGVTFPLFDKVAVNGPDAHPLFTFLKQQAPGILGSQDIKWNFTKFLIGRAGTVRERYAPMTAPESLSADIEKQLVAL